MGVTSKIPEVRFEPISDDRRRSLQDGVACKRIFGNSQACIVEGLLSYDKMVHLHQQFCQGWDPNDPDTFQGCSGGGVSKIRLNCGGRISYLYDNGLDEYSPYRDPDYGEYTIFPGSGKAYDGTAYLYPERKEEEDCKVPPPYVGPPCLQDFKVGMFCDTLAGVSECLILAAMPEGTQPCFGAQFVDLCGRQDPCEKKENGNGGGNAGGANGR